MSSEVHVTLSEVLAQRAPAVKSKVTVPLRARSSHSGEGSPVTVLNKSLGPDDEVLQELAAAR